LLKKPNIFGLASDLVFLNKKILYITLPLVMFHAEGIKRKLT